MDNSIIDGFLSKGLGYVPSKTWDKVFNKAKIAIIKDLCVNEANFHSDGVYSQISGWRQTEC